MSPVTYVLRLLRWFKGHPLAVSVVVFCLLIEMGFNAFIPMAFSHLIDAGITPRNSTVLVHTLVALGIATVITTAAGMTSDYTYARLSSGVLARVRQRLFDHLQTLSPSFFQKYSAGEISARYSNDLVAVEHTLGSWLPWGWKPALDVIGYNAVMFTVDWRLALFAQLLWPMTLLGPRIFAPRAGAAAEERKNREAEVLTAVDEATAGRNVVRAFGLESTMGQRFASKLGSLAATAVRGAFFTSALERSASIGIYALQIAILGLGGSMAFKGSITVGGLVAFYTVFISLSSSLYYIAQYTSSLINSAAGLVRIEEVLNEVSAVPDAAGAHELPPFHEAIHVRDYVFTPEPDRRILDGVSLTIRHGESVAFVGPSGSGKSTVLNAMMRSFDPNGGSIEIDGHDLRAVTKASFIRQSAVVFQESFLYHTTVRENVRLGRIDATDAEIEAACRDAEIHPIIMAMPKGYDSPVGERGSLLSGGQKQRLAIARALLRDPRILFLDEATSALDPGTEIAVNATLQRISRGRTVVSVTHRLASVANCDRIFVLNHGQLAERGTHAELLARNGLYASLWHKQEGIRTSDDGAHADITIERLKQFALLAKLSDAMLHVLATEQFVTENVPAGRDVVLEGDPGDKFYIIARGRVEVLKRDAAGANQAVHLLEDGDNFGELALLRDVPRTATIRTLIPSIFLSLQRQHFQKLLDHSPDVRAAILAQEAERSATPYPAGTIASFSPGASRADDGTA
jgi:ATP-binding cassette subfamily B protein